MRLRALCLTRLRKRKKPVIFIQIAGARPRFSAHDSRSRHKPESYPRHSAILENLRPASGFLKWNSALFLYTVRSVQSTTEPLIPSAFGLSDTKENTMQKREFLKGGLAALGGFGFLSAAGASEKWPATEEIQWDETWDTVIVGSGIAST